MKRILFAAAVALGAVAPIRQAPAVTCANGAYRVGCVGPNGAAVVRKPPPHAAYPRPYYVPRPPAAHYARPPTIACAQGPYRAGCVGPNGAVVVRKPS